MIAVSIAGVDPARVILDLWRASPYAAGRADILTEPTLEQIRADFGLLAKPRPLLSGCGDYHGRMVQVVVDSETNELKGPGAERARTIVERLRSRM